MIANVEKSLRGTAPTTLAVCSFFCSVYLSLSRVRTSPEANKRGLFKKWQIAFTLLFFAPFVVNAQSDGPWWDSNWNYRTPVSIDSDLHERIDRPIEVSVNFSQLLADVGDSGQFDPASIRVLEVDEAGQTTNTTVPFQFDRDSDFDEILNASGNLIFLAQGTTLQNSSRNYHIYFDLITAEIPTSPVANQVTVTDDVFDEGQSSIQIDTPSATYFYHKAGAGFSSLIDSDGNDWIDHHPTGGSAGSFRGIPNLVYPEGHFHPGATSSVTTLVNQGPLKATIHSITNDNLWEGIWEIFPNHAQFTVLRADHDYWFLYEGTPGGLLEEAIDFVMRSDGTQSLLADNWTLDLPGEEWVYFADPIVGRSLFLANHTDDVATDSYRPLDSLMTVFGFGRDGLNTELNQIPGEFTISLIDSTDFNNTSKVGLSSVKPLSINLETTQTLAPLAPGIVTQPSSITVVDGDTVEFSVTASGTAPLSYQWEEFDGSEFAPINGETTDTLTLPAVSFPSDDGRQFRVIVNNALGSVTSAIATLSVSDAPARVIADLEAFYLFSAGTGNTVFDMAGSGTPLDLTIPDTAAVNWLAGGGLELSSPIRIASAGPATALADSIALNGEITLEAWIRPTNLTQNGPARIVTLSGSPTSRNLTLGQGVSRGSSERYNARLRTTATSNNGEPSLSTPVGSLTTDLTHVVFTRNSSGSTQLYLNGLLSATGTAAGNLSNWDPTFGFALGEEFNSSTRSWLGEFRLVALYSRALSEPEINQNFGAGPNGSNVANTPPSASFTANPNSGNTPLSVDFDASTSTDDQTIVAYEWNFGDGTTDTTVTPLTNHVFAAGTFTVTLTVRDNQGATDTTSTTITAEDPPGPPLISSGPQNQIVVDGDSVQFSVTASGTAPLSYQWEEFDGSEFAPINGETTDTLTLPAVSFPSDDGRQFRVIVNNALGSVTSAIATLSVSDAPARVIADLEAFYLFSAGTGNTVFDMAGSGTPLDLTIPDTAAVNWLAGGGLELSSPIRIASAGPATALADSIALNGEITLEAWIRPTNLTQNGPARIVTLSGSPTSRNLTLGQGVSRGSSERYNARLRTTATSNNGEPSLSTPVGSLTTDLTHVVFTRNSSGSTQLYLNGLLSATGTAAGNLSNWDPTFGFALGEEFNSSTRSWLGEFRLVALYSRALSEPEINQNFGAGPNGSNVANTPPSASFTANPNSGNTPLSVDFDASTSTDDQTIVAYEWNFGDGTTDTTVTPLTNHVFAAGTFTVTLTVRDNQGATDTTSTTITAEDPPGPPLISSGPQNQIVVDGDSVQFSVTASGTAPLSYQWEEFDGSEFAPINGETTDTLTLPAVSFPSDDGRQFRVIVNNALGSVTSAIATLSVSDAPARVIADLEAFYLFSAGTGNTVFDMAGSGTPLDLTIPDTAAVNWLAGGGLELSSPIRIASAGPATALADSIALNGEITLEAWIRPTNLTQNGPARIVTLSGSPTSRNLTLGQGVSRGSSERYNARLRTTATSNNGEPSLSTPVGSLTTDLTHVVFTRNSSGSTQLYLNGLLSATGTAAGNLSNWDPTFGFALGEEFNSSTRSWLGEFRLVALYSRALSEPEINQNFGAGPNGSNVANTPPSASFTANPNSGNTPLSVDFDASTSTDDQTIVAYEWNFGDGTTDTTVTPLTNHVFAAGTFTVTLTVRDNQGATDTTSTTITAEDPPGPPLISSGPQNQIVVDGDSVQFSVTASGTAPLSYQWEEFDGSEFAPINGETTDTLTLPAVSFPSDDGRQFRVIVNNALGSVTSDTATLSVSDTVADPQLAVELRLDEGSGIVAMDTSRSGNDGQLIGGPVFESNTHNNSPYALRLDGVDDYIDVGPIDVEGSGLTLSIWFNAGNFFGPSNDPRLISKASGLTANDHVFMLSTVRVGSSTRLRARLRVSGTTQTLVATSGNLATNIWQHATLTHDGEIMRLYLDGIEVGSTALAGQVDVEPTIPVAIGAQPPGAGNRFFNGLVDDVRIFQRALNAEDVAALTAGETPENQPPVAVIDNYQTSPATPLIVNATDGVLSNDTDPEFGVLLAELETGVSNGILNLSADGSFEYTPNNNFSGMDSFSYRANDGLLNSAPVIVTLDVFAPPTANDDNYSLDEDGVLDVMAVNGLLANDLDANPPINLSANVLSSPSNGTLVSTSSDGAFSYIPSLDFNGVDSFTYQAIDGNNGVFRQAVVTLMVNAINDPPIANTDFLITAPNTPIDINIAASLLFNDDDVDGDNLTLESYTLPADGILIDNNNGTLTYLPNTGFSGSDGFTYIATDGFVNSNETTVSIDVTLQNSEPMFMTGKPGFVKKIAAQNLDETHAAVAADFDDDGDIDLAATDFIDDDVYWYENDGSGNYTEIIVDNDLDGAYPISVADLDSDGDSDLLATGYNADSVVWYENDGAANFTRRTIDASADGAHSVVAVDLDLDGDQDLLTTNQDAGSVNWYQNDGNNSFTILTIDSAAIDAKYAVAADLDNDGDSDVVAASNGANEIAWYENDGSENFSKRIIDNNSRGAYFVSTANLDDDSDIDILAASQNDNSITWYKNNGDGTFNKNNIDSTASGARTAVAVDLDGDGDIDAVAASVNNDTLAWYENIGNGDFFARRTVDNAADGAYGVYTADLDGDGDIDLLSANRDANNVVVHTQTRFHEATLTQGDTLTIDAALLWIFDADDGPSELIYTITNEPDFGSLQLNGTQIVNGSQFSQSDINGGSIQYVHGGTNNLSDQFDFSVSDGGGNGVQPITGLFTINMIDEADLLVQLPLNEGNGNVASDISGTGNDGILVNDPVFDTDTPDSSSFSIRLDGANDYIDLGPLDVNGSGLTLATWFKANSFAGDPRLISKATGSAANQHIFMISTFQTGGNTILRARLRIGGVTSTLIANGGNLTAGEWMHAALTYNGSTMNLYLDGVEVSSVAVNGPVDVDPAVNVAIGAQPAGAGGSHFNGLLDDVRILQRALSETEITQIIQFEAGL